MVNVFYRLSRLFHKLGWRFGGVVVSAIGRIIFSGWIPGAADIGKGVTFGYWGLGIVIHNDAVIGDRCHVCQNVTIGRGGSREGVPVLEDEVYVGAGAVILGGVRIGRGAIVGANSVVTRDVEAGLTVAGAPAREIPSK